MTARTMALWVLAAATFLTVAVTFAPWLRTGAAQRTSYQAAQSAVHLDLVHGFAATALTRSWFLLPFAASLSFLSLLFDRVLPTVILAVFIGVVVTVFAVVITTSPRHAAWGARAGLILGPTLVLGALGTVALTRHPRLFTGSSDDRP